MELVYVWVKMKDKEYNFNFSKEYSIEYDYKKKKISLTKESKLNIFNENKNEGGVNQVYALIGKNGSGKTTLLRNFLEHDYLEGSGKTFEIMCLFKDGDYKIYTNDFIRLDNEICINIKNEEKEYKIEYFENELNPIYYNPYLGNYLTSSNINTMGDISYERRFSNTVSRNAFRDIWSKDIKRIYTMFSAVRKEDKLEELNGIVTNKNKDSLKEIKILFFPITDESLNAHNLKTSFDNISELDFEDHYNFKGYNDYSESKKSFIKEFYKKILLKIKGSSDNSNLKFNKSLKSIKKINFKEIEEWINEIENKIKDANDEVENKQNIDDLRDKIKDFKNFKETLDFLDTIKCRYTKGTRTKDKKNYLYSEITLEEVLDRWDKFIDLVSKGYIEIETGFSDGEWSMLKLFANLYNELNASHNESKNEFLVILDEGVIEDLTTLECFKREEELLKKLENMEESKLSDSEKEKKEMLKKHKETREAKESEIRDKQGEIKYVIDQIGERVLSRKLGEKYRDIFIGEKEEKTKDKMKSLYSRLSEEEREALKKEIGGQQ